MNKKSVLFSILTLVLTFSFVQFGMGDGRSGMMGEGKSGMMGGQHGMKNVPDWGKSPVSNNPASQKRGKQFFNGRCAMCHGPQGKGDGPVGVTLNPKPSDLTRSRGMFSAGQLAGMIAEGRGLMPSFGGTLKKNDIWDIVNYIQTLK